MYLVDEEVMQFALSNFTNINYYAILSPEMKVIPIASHPERFTYFKDPILNQPRKEQIYIKDTTEHSTVRLNRTVGALEVYYPYTLAYEKEDI